MPEPEPQEDELPDLAAFGEGASEEDGYEEGTLAPEDLDALPIYGEDGELPPFPDDLEELGRRRPRRGGRRGGCVAGALLGRREACESMTTRRRPAIAPGRCSP